MVLHPEGMTEGSQGQAKRSPWTAGRRKPGAPWGGAREGVSLPNTLRTDVRSGVPSGREFFCLRFQGLRFACPWLPSCIPFGMQTSSYVAL